MSDDLPPFGRRVLIKRRIPADFFTGLTRYYMEIASRQITTVVPEGAWAWLTDMGYWYNPKEVEKWVELPKL